MVSANDVVALAMRQAAQDFGAKDKLTFNGAGFSNALTRIAGVRGAIDGHVVKAILCGRSDVRPLAGGSHYKLIDEAP